MCIFQILFDTVHVRKANFHISHRCSIRIVWLNMLCCLQGDFVVCELTSAYPIIATSIVMSSQISQFDDVYWVTCPHYLRAIPIVFFVLWDNQIKTLVTSSYSNRSLGSCHWASQAAPNNFDVFLGLRLDKIAAIHPRLFHEAVQVGATVARLLVRYLDVQ